MKLKELNTIFPIVTKVYDSIEDFQRKLELSVPYREMKENIEFIEDERQKILKKYSDDKGKMTENNQRMANFEFTDLLNAESKIKKPLKFTEKEVENSKIKGSELSEIVEFIK